jgi:tetratricopeptide (TPR) repeat protein
MLLRLDFGPIAEEYGLKAVSLDPKLPLAHQLLGELYLYQSKIPEAVAQLEQEVAVNPANPVALYKLADAYTRIQKFDEAEKLLQRSIWTPLPPVPTSSWEKCWRRRVKRCLRCAPCNAPSTWIPTILIRTTRSARLTATSAVLKMRNANSN